MLEKKVVSQCISSDYCKGWNDAVDAMPSWISVEERLPETETWVLCWYVDIDGDKWHTVGKLLKDGIWVVDIYETDEPEYYTVTHWMPLPEPPKEE